MKYTSRQAGNVIEWLIIGLVLIGAIALIAWRYIETNKTQMEADQAANTTNIVPSDADVEHLREWGNIFVYEPKELHNKAGEIKAVFYKDAATGADAYYLVSDTLKKADFKCEKTSSLESNGAFIKIMRSHNQEPSAPGITTKKLGEYYYWVEKAPQGTCYSPELMSTYFADDYAAQVLRNLTDDVL